MKMVITMLVALSAVSACSDKKEPDPAPVIIETKYVTRPGPVVPKADQLSLRPIHWDVVTKDNVAVKLEKTPVLFALSEGEYKKLALNLADVRSHVEQQKLIIQTYKNHHSKP